MQFLCVVAIHSSILYYDIEAKRCYLQKTNKNFRHGHLAKNYHTAFNLKSNTSNFVNDECLRILRNV